MKLSDQDSGVIIPEEKNKFKIAIVCLNLNKNDSYSCLFSNGISLAGLIFALIFFFNLNLYITVVELINS